MEEFEALSGGCARLLRDVQPYTFLGVHRTEYGASGSGHAPGTVALVQLC